MTRFLSKPSAKTGLPPGAMIHVGDRHQDETVVTVIDYSAYDFQEIKVKSAEEIVRYKDHGDTTTWVIVEGLSNTDLIAQIGRVFDIHPLVVEDILTTHQRPKFEAYDHYLFLVINSLTVSDEDEVFDVSREQVCLVLMENIVLVFKEKTDDLFQPLVQRIQSGRGRFRTMGADYLTYAILDIVIDRLFFLTESLDDRIASIEDTLMALRSTHGALDRLQNLKRELIQVRKYVSPMRELIAQLLRSDSELIHAKTRIYFRDVSDHAIRAAEAFESYKDTLSELLGIYTSAVSNRMNEVMKVLTIFASIFIPLTFLAGIYGMNFEYMPELKWKWAYPALWVIFIGIPIILLIYFKKKKWL